MTINWIQHKIEKLVSVRNSIQVEMMAPDNTTFAKETLTIAHSEINCVIESLMKLIEG